MHTNPSQMAMPIPDSIQDHIRRKVFHDSPSRGTFHDPHHLSDFHTPLPLTPQQPQPNAWPLSSASKSTAPKLVPLISKFETLDAASMGFSVRDAQPPHLRLPRSRMDDRKDMNMQSNKTTRERLLSLFERPGWGAGTLRGFQGIDNADDSVVFDEISYGNERSFTRIKKYEDIEPPQHRSRLPVSNNLDTWLGKAKATGVRARRESKIKDKIKFFDGSMDRHLSHVREMWNRSRADSAVATNSSSTHPSIFSPNGPRFNSQSPAKQSMGGKTPAKSYGNLVYKQKRPSPLKTPDWRDKVNRDLPNQWEITHNRSQNNEQFRRPPDGQPYVKESAALRNINIVYKDPKRKVSEKIEAIYSAGERQRERQADRRFGLDQRAFSNASTLATRLASDTNFIELNTAEKGNLNIKEQISDTNKSKSTGGREIQAQAKRSKIQDRIKLFSNDGVPMVRSEEPVCPVRSYHSGGSLASRPQLLISSELSRPSHLAIAQPENPPVQTHLHAPTRNSIISMAIPEPTEQPEQRYSEPNAGRALSNTERNWSHINERIQHFEAFRRVQPARAVKKPVNYNRTWPRPKAVGVATSPLAPGEHVSKPQKARKVTRLPSSAKKETNPAIWESSPEQPLLTLSEKGKAAKASRDEERHRRKITSRQERLTRRSRSRSRSVLSIPSPTKGKGKNRQDPANAGPRMEMEIDMAMVATAATDKDNHTENEHVQELWIDGHSEEGQGGETFRVHEQVVAQCVLSHPRPVRLAETLRMLSLCRRGFEERERGRERERERDREREMERERSREQERHRIKAGAGAGWRWVVGLEPEVSRYDFMGAVQERL